MASKKKKAAVDSVLSVIDELLPSDTIVTVNGGEIPVRVPSETEISAVRSLQLAMGEADEAGEADVGRDMLNLSVACVQACIPELNEYREKTVRLIFASGAETGELVTTAMKFCGINREVADAIEKGESDIPT